MLRNLLNVNGDTEDQDPLYTDAVSSIATLREILKQREAVIAGDIVYRLDLMAEGLEEALFELEQSFFAANQLSLTEIRARYTDKIAPEKRYHYRLYVYFYKNTLIRIFSTLDKLGHFMNLLYDLKTESVKRRFSYYTALRRMYDRKKHRSIQSKLFEWKERFADEMQALRQQRNLEIHVLNINLRDEMLFLEQTLPTRIRVEDMERNMSLLRVGFEMVCRTLNTLFSETNKLIRKTGRLPWI